MEQAGRQLESDVDKTQELKQESLRPYLEIWKEGGAFLNAPSKSHLSSPLYISLKMTQGGAEK